VSAGEGRPAGTAWRGGNTLSNVGRASVRVDYHQFDVVGEPPAGMAGPETLLPGLVTSTGPGCLQIITGRQWGDVEVNTAAAAGPPALDNSWEVVGEVDLVCSTGRIWVSDWAGPSHSELEDLATVGVGLYRLRVHAKGRSQGADNAVESYWLVAWPSSEARPPEMLTPLDAYGEAFVNPRAALGGEGSPADEPDDIVRAAWIAVERLGAIVNGPPRPQSDGTAVVRVSTMISNRRQDIYDIAAVPAAWVGGASSFPAIISWRYGLWATGSITLDDRPDHLTFTWAWTAGLHGWELTDPPQTIDIRFAPEDTSTRVGLIASGVPADLSDYTKSFWTWGLHHLATRASGRANWKWPWYH
jgi:hypothetical protein